MSDAKSYLQEMFNKFEKVGYTQDQVMQALSEYYDKEMMAC